MKIEQSMQASLLSEQHVRAALGDLGLQLLKSNARVDYLADLLSRRDGEIMELKAKLSELVPKTEEPSPEAIPAQPVTDAAE